MARQTVYDWREADPTFAADWDAALEEGTECLEDEARRRAVEGTERKFYDTKGNVTGSTTTHSDTLLIFLLKGRNPDRYRDQSTVKHEGNPERPIIVERVTFARDNDPR